MTYLFYSLEFYFFFFFLFRDTALILTQIQLHNCILRGNVSSFAFIQDSGASPRVQFKVTGLELLWGSAVLDKTSLLKLLRLLLKDGAAQLPCVYREHVRNVFKLLISDSMDAELQKVGSFSEVTQTSGFDVVQQELKEER